MNFYIHIPFCRQKCPYCKFALTPIFDDIKKRRYIEYLKKEIQEYISNHTLDIDTIYFGGGTPSILRKDEIQDILHCFYSKHTFHTIEGMREEYSITGVGNNLQINSQSEISFECNPEDITIDSIRDILGTGCNRISLGVQSLNNATLRSIHRSNSCTIIDALDHIQRAIEESQHNISLNVDLILGLPHSNPGETLDHIHELHRRFPCITHTSVYMLESGEYPKSWKNSSMNELEMQTEYQKICEYFESIGWNHYEISNWAKPGYECKHNQGYWNHTPYRGFGLAATSYEYGVRTENSSSFSGYYRGQKAIENLTLSELELERIIYGIRTFSLGERDFSEKIQQKLEQEGMIFRKNGKIILTPAGIFRENTIIAELIDELPP